MEKSSKRGKIPQSDWPLIMARYEVGETLASIARTYDCSPPAISYVVSRSRARQPDIPPAAAPGATEPQLIKTAPPESANGESKTPDPAAPPPVPPSAAPFASEPAPVAERPDPAAVASQAPRDVTPPRSVNGLPPDGAGGRDPSFPGLPPRAVPLPQRPSGSPLAAGATANGDQRRTLHLSLGQTAPGNGRGHSLEPPPVERHSLVGVGPGPQHQAPSDRVTATANPEPQRGPAASERGSATAGPGFSDTHAPPYQAPPRAPDPNGPPRKDAGGSFIDQELRARVDGDIAAFLAAFDAALAEDTQASRSALREATDRLLRAGARTRIELERLEARMPLSPRDNGGRSEPAWRHQR